MNDDTTEFFRAIASQKDKRAQHTPGPWHLGLRQAERIVYDAKGWAVANATVYHGARLISAAPDLLASLESLFEHCVMVHSKWGEGCNQREANAAIAAARAAIASAKGGR